MNMKIVTLNGPAFDGQTVTMDHYETQLKVLVEPVKGLTNSEVGTKLKEIFQQQHEVMEIKTITDGFLIAVRHLHPISESRIRQTMNEYGIPCKEWSVFQKIGFAFTTRAA